MHLFKRGVASGLAVLITVQATGCTTWRTVDQPVPLAVAASPNRKLRVILQDKRSGGSFRRFDADSATTDATTVIAYRAHTVDTIPLAEVKKVKVRKVSALRTVGLVLGIVAGAYMTIGGIMYAVQCDGTCAY